NVSLKKTPTSAALCDANTHKTATLFDTEQLLNQCPFPKTQSPCMENRRAVQIVNGLRAIVPDPSKCTSDHLQLFVEQTQACTPNMKAYLATLPSSDSLGQQIYSACRFP